MHTVRWMTLAFVGWLIGIAAAPFSISFAASASQSQPPLNVEITVAQSESPVGMPTTWHIALMPLDSQTIGPIELRPGTQAWNWPDGALVIDELLDATVVRVTAVPTRVGDLTPHLEIRYSSGESQLFTGKTAVRVKPVETYVEAGLVAMQGTVGEGDGLPVEVWLHNGSPFTLTNVRTRGVGIDLRWETSASLGGNGDVSPDETIWQVLTPTVSGQHPQPRLNLEYTWSDGNNVSHTHALYVSGETVALEEGVMASVFGRIPDEVLGIILGLIAGALTGFVSDWVSRTIQTRVNRRQLCGLLRMAVMRAEYAANNNVEMNLTPLEMVFTQEGLYAVMVKNNLDQDVRALWRAAQRYNVGLNLLGGPERSDRLRDAASMLSQRLDVLCRAKRQ